MKIHVEIGDNLNKLFMSMLQSMRVDGVPDTDLDIGAILEQVIRASSLEGLRERFLANLEEALPLGEEKSIKYLAVKAFEDAVKVQQEA